MGAYSVFVYVCPLLSCLVQRRGLAGQQGAAVLVVARQSKSVVLGVWEVAQLVDSNMQLTAVTETRDGEDYVVSRLGHWANLVYDPVNN